MIHIFGASGAGTTTLGKQISRVYGYKHLDTDDYFWEQTDPPYTEKRPAAERQALLGADIEKYKRCVITGSLCGRGDSWGDIFIPLLDLVIYLDTPTKIRLQRLQEREYRRYGDRILPGGDLHLEHVDFLDWASQYDDGGLDMRSRALHHEWMKKLPKNLIKLDGSLSPDILMQNLKPYLAL